LTVSDLVISVTIHQKGCDFEEKKKSILSAVICFKIPVIPLSSWEAKKGKNWTELRWLKIICFRE